MDLSITLLGTAASVPTAHRSLPSLLLRAGSKTILFDAGEGAQRQMMRAGGLPDLDAIFISHFHLDHWFGLAGIIKSFDLRDREKPLWIYGPEHLHEKLATIKSLVGGVNYELNYSEFPDDGKMIIFDDGFTVYAFPVKHRARCYGFKIAEPTQPGRVFPNITRELGITNGADIGRILGGETVDGVTRDQIVGPERPGRSIVYSADTSPSLNVVKAAKGASLLIHEATFTSDEMGRARKTGHSTGAEAGLIAYSAQVDMLLLTHISSRTHVGLLEREAQEQFPGAKVARDFDRVTIPPRDKGKPVVDNLRNAGRFE